MMNNTLEEKKESVLSDELVEEEWMKKPLDQMTDEEKGKLEDFRVKKQKLEEETSSLP